jgi:hypothetical protein
MLQRRPSSFCLSQQQRSITRPAVSCPLVIHFRFLSRAPDSAADANLAFSPKVCCPTPRSLTRIQWPPNVGCQQVLCLTIENVQRSANLPLIQRLAPAACRDAHYFFSERILVPGAYMYPCRNTIGSRSESIGTSCIPCQSDGLQAYIRPVVISPTLLEALGHSARHSNSRVPEYQSAECEHLSPLSAPTVIQAAGPLVRFAGFKCLLVPTV